MTSTKQQVPSTSTSTTALTTTTSTTQVQSQHHANVYYSFISRFLDNEIPTVNANFKEFLIQDGVIQMLMSFITLNFPPGVTRVQNVETTNWTTTSSSAEVPPEVLKSYKVMNLFVHPTPPLISLAKDRLPIILSSLFEIFNYNNNSNGNGTNGTSTSTTTTSTSSTSSTSSSLSTSASSHHRIEDPAGNIHHFAKVILCLFNQFTYDTVNALAEIYSPAQRSYFQILVENLRHPPIKDMLLAISKRAARKMSEYQTTNPLDTKKIQKGLTKSKFFNMLVAHFAQPTRPVDVDTGFIDLEGCAEFMIRCVEELNIHGPDIGLPFCHLQNKEFADTLGKIVANEGGKKYAFEHRHLAMNVIAGMIRKSNEFSSQPGNQHQAEKDSIFSSSGTTLWATYFSNNQLPALCRLLTDMGSDESFKKTITSFRVDALALLIDMVKVRASSKKKAASQSLIPPELWTLLVDWFFQFHNVYQSKFYNLIIEVFNEHHLPSIKQLCSHLKRFIQYYTTVDQSDTKGVVLLMLNFIRLSADTHQPNSYLPTFLKGSDEWQQFRPQLLNDTLKQYQSNIKGNANADATVAQKDNALNQSFAAINLGSDFADSIGFEDPEKKKKKPSAGTKVVVDELNNEQMSKIEAELVDDDEDKKKKKKNKKK
ncbi:hypothetical protein SAMD00019534_044200 [Acytostelium subglobosum LB1]|uniref:hypothetical protein n=1 Tax=Acytostelium subglobosum LB1 TaxID=1410327 RepID=UPI000644DC37|nr:hypothetical protein SAMD00019534_044200 [Acytostelium subglobosum LB1]GAM21245.1 hypothetical protein SAMD00019534_044200 [Acytostelium subglobosum LB1]|eukprot:XP_012755364.1 hypothetical protein SAMD00019534_044200 [Acytostelium subglobosum LB1]